MFKIELTQEELECVGATLDYFTSELTHHMDATTESKYIGSYNKLKDILYESH